MRQIGFPGDEIEKDTVMKYHHVGIPTTGRFAGEIDLPHLKMTVSDHANNSFGIQWMRFWDGAPYPELVKTVPHVAFEVESLEVALRGRNVITEANSPTPGVLVAMIEVDGAPVELMQIDRSIGLRRVVGRDRSPRQNAWRGTLTKRRPRPKPGSLSTW